MSTAETSGHDPNSIQQDPKRPEETLAPELPPDPLLKSGTFIAVPQDATTAEPPPQLRRSSDDAAPACLAAEKSNGEAAPAPASESAASMAETPPRRAPAAVPDWLPAGWTVEDRVRSSGVTAGTVDRRNAIIQNGPVLTEEQILTEIKKDVSGRLEFKVKFPNSTLNRILRCH